MSNPLSPEGTKPLKILISAVEPSGDSLGAALMRSLKALSENIQFIGCGGALMAKEGLSSLFPIEPLTVIGPASALKAWPAAMNGAKMLAEASAREQVDAAVFIDGWAFSKIAAEKIRKTNSEVCLYKYVAPQVWASRPHRAKTLAKIFDGVLTLFAFESEWFEREGVAAQFVGSSTFQTAAAHQGDIAAFRQRHDIGDAPLLAVLPGSRRSEVRRLLEPFRQTVERLRQERPALRTMIPVAPGMDDEVREAARGWPGGAIFIDADERLDAFAAADAALAASGTVTTELAIKKTPMVVGYKVGWFTAWWVRRVITVDHVSLINIAAGKEVIPELLQEDCSPEKLAAALGPLLEDSNARYAQLAAIDQELQKFGVGGADAADQAARTILQWVRPSKADLQ